VIDYLPEVVFPFLKVFRDNMVATLEILATFFRKLFKILKNNILENWGKDWFQFYPNGDFLGKSKLNEINRIKKRSTLKNFGSHNKSFCHLILFHANTIIYFSSLARLLAWNCFQVRRGLVNSLVRAVTIHQYS
jgi:hypothetical protein